MAMKIAPVLWVAGDGVQHAPVHHAFTDPSVPTRHPKKDAFTDLLDPKASVCPKNDTMRRRQIWIGFRLFPARTDRSGVRMGGGVSGCSSPGVQLLVVAIALPLLLGIRIAETADSVRLVNAHR